MLPARFTRTFILVVLALVLFSSFLLLLRTPSIASPSSYFDPYRGVVFDSDGVEKDLDRPYQDKQIPKPIIIPEGEKKPLQGVHGGVIMGRLGNATAKYVRLSQI